MLFSICSAVPALLRGRWVCAPGWCFGLTLAIPGETGTQARRPRVFRMSPLLIVWLKNMFTSSSWQIYRFHFLSWGPAANYLDIWTALDRVLCSGLGVWIWETQLTLDFMRRKGPESTGRERNSTGDRKGQKNDDRHWSALSLRQFFPRFQLQLLRITSLGLYRGGMTWTRGVTWTILTRLSI